MLINGLTQKFYSKKKLVLYPPQEVRRLRKWHHSVQEEVVVPLFSLPYIKMFYMVPAIIFGRLAPQFLSEISWQRYRISIREMKSPLWEIHILVLLAIRDLVIKQQYCWILLQDQISLRDILKFLTKILDLWQKNGWAIRDTQTFIIYYIYITWMTTSP